MSSRKYKHKCGFKDKAETGLHGKEEKHIRSAYRTFCEKRGLRMGFNQFKPKSPWVVDEEY